MDEGYGIYSVAMFQNSAENWVDENVLLHFPRFLIKAALIAGIPGFRRPRRDVRLLCPKFRKD